MNIAIIGGGLTGLTAACELTKRGHQVTVFEKEKTLGGLAGGFKKRTWQWSLEKTYHHFFTNDRVLISLTKELGLEKEIIIKRPITATLCQPSAVSYQSSENVRAGSEQNFAKECGERTKFCAASLPLKDGADGEDEFGTEDASKFSFATSAFRENTISYPYIFQLDSPLNLLTFPLLSPIDKVRTGTLLGFCKLNPFWQPLETITAKQFFKTIGGSAGWRTLWQPLMTGKFGTHADQVPASWLWARIKKRTPSLGYFRGGFQTLIDRLATKIKEQNGTIVTNCEIASITKELRVKSYELRIKKNQKKFCVLPFTYCFDAVLITTPSSVATKLIHFPNNYTSRLQSIPHLWAQTLILETKKPILPKTYWLNVADPTFPFIAVVAHTNYMDKKHYGGKHITYIGNYLPDHHPFLKMTKQQLLKKFLPYLKQINSQFAIRNSLLFTVPFAQPVHTLNYSQKAPPIKTPIEGIYLANLDSIYPWDRGINYAVELGKKAASVIHTS